MKELGEVIKYAKDEPKKFILDCFAVICIFGFFYALLLLASILEGNA